MSQLLDSLKQLTLDIDQIQNETHPEYKLLLSTLEATKSRLLAMAQLQYNSDIHFSEQTKKVSRKTFDNDYKLGISDAYNSVQQEIQKRKTDLIGILSKLNASEQLEQLENIKIE
ncbi:hypothetical protein SS50377_23336 [Spironucleus salmonicida]|uniref:Uncharacterized protein n=1 Tax=Spironucleus salmonicida TaxID=348837 RepID=V6LU44_9EUKA|nr:hypothetical protein SS50377_23336 [Spironucleus salmonicida]|eukprot:EST47206.1 Hypothetical protein SS50377_12716 [Spironucleus salmonicida]